MALAGQLLMGCDSSTDSPPTDPNAQIVILSPKGGETFRIGQSLPVRWKTQGKGELEINAVSLELSPDDGVEWILMVNRSIGVDDGEWGDFAWTIPSQMTRLGKTYDLAGNSSLRIRIKQYGSGDPNKTAVLAKPFTVTQ